MRLTKQLEREARDLIDAYWTSYINGDVKATASLLDNNYSQVGSAESEVFSSKKDAVQFLHDTIAQVTGKVQMRNRSTKVEALEDCILVNDLCDLYAFNDNDWIFYAKFRASSLLHKKRGKWKIIHQHSSFPDAKTEEGGNLAIENIAAENLQLRDAVKRRTIELEQKNRELGIETALEKVRAVAMGMKDPAEMLEICRTISHQLELLGVKDIRNVQTAIINEATGMYLNYEYFTQYKRTSILNIETKLHPTVAEFANEMLKSSDAFFTKTFKGKALQDWREYRRKTNQDPDPILDKATSVHYYFYSIGPGALGVSTYAPLNDGDIANFRRFRNVFALAYRRFIDIELAIAQAREAKIEAALERVRSKAMAMHKSDDLSSAVEAIFEELDKLNLGMVRCGIGILNKEKRSADVWTTSVSDQGRTVQVSGDESMDIHPLLQGAFAAWLRQEDFSYVLEGKDLNKYYRALTHVNFKLPESQSLIMEKEGLQQHYYVATFQAGGLFAFRDAPFPDEARAVMKRFAGVFNLTYSRFLDLQKAEAQTREARIEAALERIRARAMAMHSSDELMDVAGILREQMGLLGQPELETSVIDLFEENSDMILSSYAFRSPELSSGKILTGVTSFPWKASALTRTMMELYHSGQQEYTMEAERAKAMELIHVLAKAAPEIERYIGEEIPDRVWYHLTFFSEGTLLMISYQPPSEEAKSLQRKAASVFDMAYRRYRDLKKAEAQAREARIEAAMERTRTQSMIMQHSKELDDTLRVFHQQVLLLGINSAFSFLWLPDEDKDRHIFWAAWAENHLTVFRSKAINYPLDRNEPATAQCLADWKSNEPVYSYHVSSAAVANYFAVWSELIAGVEQLNPEYFKEGLHYVEAFMKYGCFGVMVKNELQEDDKKILARFAIEFERTYTRFLDLKKAEAQTREATIEASLEKVRGKAMAMHTSSDISETMGVVFSELPKLGIGSLRCGVALFSRDSRRVIFYAAANALESDSLTLIGTGEMSGHPEFENQYECWLKQENYFVTLSDEALRSYYEALYARLSAPYTPREHREQTEHGYYFPFSTGNFYAWSEKPYSESEIDILQRFKTIIDLTFRRYLDLQKAEAQAREAQIETSLERVRSRTLAMQKSNELAETAAVLFRQLITLGIAPNRLYIAIMRDESGNAEFWITDEDGSTVSTGFSANLHGNSSFLKMFEGWQDGKKSITIDMQGRELQEYFQHLSSLNVPFKGGLSQTRRVQNIAYFSRGFIGIASPDKQPEETTTLLERFAAVFNLTLTRFNDLKLAEAQAHQAHIDLIHLQAEKKRAEDALSELSATQAQLVQQEKLASLGQLTAGIAHEIKNPLNFVNNFSSVSVELVDEVMDEITKSASHLSTGEVPHLLADIKANLAKIIEHGTRADGIVKSMLQHSRGGTSRMEPTDLNALIKEYVNLAFHGMRASKNPINVDIELDFDKAIGSVLLKAEDFSRVIINLCQNAFDAMRDKGGSQSGAYLPKLTVRTRREPNRIAINIEDNGPGIPEEIREKVLQPFFTTKKGTQGTGLGLSITNDIVKAHGGEMKIETNGGGGATFTIGLPAEKQK